MSTSLWHRVRTKAASLVAIIISTVGPGSFVAVGYMDPGNWATDLAAGANFEHKLLSVVLLSGIIAISLQSLTIRLGLVTGRDLPQMCRQEFHPTANFVLWILAELAIIATDLAEVLGAAIALHMLFGLRIPYGVLIMGLDVFVVLAGFSDKHLRYFEMFIFFLIFSIGLCFTVLLSRLPVSWGTALQGYVPSSLLVTDPQALYMSLGILGATVMPHNLYLHGALVQFRSPAYRERQQGLLNKTGNGAIAPTGTAHTNTGEGGHEMQTLHHLNVDSMCSLLYATIVNSFILMTAAAAFYGTPQADEMGGIEDAYGLLQQMLGKAVAALFALGLLFSGQCSTITGTLASQIVMEGFLGGMGGKRQWARRLITRSIAIVPSLIVTLVFGDSAVDRLLVISQVCLSALLPFAVWPLVYFTNSRRIMTVEFVSPVEDVSIDDVGVLGDQRRQAGETVVCYANSWWFGSLMVLVAVFITVLNVFLLTQVSAMG
ncbi:natural resistance-associated macrophage protein-domain-containing protein [Chytriomyces cf. hyalinus JEL632]|nr:natural resistance-associated macrophage protein-domain-containing protein [Chytriomyces cf. hyalinus JEL632]